MYWIGAFPSKSFIPLTLYQSFKCNSSLFKTMNRMKTFYSCILHSALETILHNVVLNLLHFLVTFVVSCTSHVLYICGQCY